MSRINQTRRAKDLPTKTPLAGTDRLIGRDAAGSMFQTPASDLLTDPLEGLVAIRVIIGGTVTNAPGRLVITGTNPSTGLFVLTCPVGWVWFTAVGGGLAQSAARTVNATNYGSRNLNVAVFNNTGALQSVDFNLMGLLVPS